MTKATAENEPLMEHMIELIHEIHTDGKRVRIRTNDLRCIWTDEEAWADTPYGTQIRAMCALEGWTYRYVNTGLAVEIQRKG